MDYKIWKFVGDYTYGDDISGSPSELNYKSGLNIRLHPYREFVSGELQSVDYYSGYDGLTYADLILRVEVDWIRSSEGVLLQRTETRKWAVDSVDSVFGPDVKVTKKFYDEKMAEIADSRRRKNIVDDLLSQAKSFGVYEANQLMFRDLSSELVLYEQTGDTKLIDEIDSYSATWLDTQIPLAPEGYTIRSAIMGQLTI